MNICCDLDSTLVNLEVEIKKVCKQNKFKYVPAKNWEMTNYPKDIQEKIFKMFQDPEIMCNLKPLYYAKTIVRKLVKQGHKVIIITARYKGIEDRTIEFAENMFKIPVHVVGQNRSKLELMKKEEIEYFIDDSPTKILEYENNGIKCIMISNKSTQYNYYMKNKVTWFKNLRQVYYYLNRWI